MLARRRCCCGSCACQTIAVRCSGSAVSGATVTITSGGTTVFTGTTDGSGQVTPCLAAGTYGISISGGTCTHSINTTITLACGGSYSFDCCCAAITVCLLCCDGSTVYSCGATVTLTDSGGATVATGTTGGSGCVTLDPTNTPATITITPTSPNYCTYTGTAPACGASHTYTLACNCPGVLNSIQCQCIPVPKTLTLSDANGSYSFVYQTSGPFAGYWYCTGTSTPVSPVVVSPGLSCLCNQTAQVGYYYTGLCVAGAAFRVTRYWNSCQANACGGVAQYAGGIGGTQGCACSNVGALPCTATGGLDNAQANLTINECVAFSVSGSLAAGASNCMPDPVGGTVSIS